MAPLVVVVCEEVALARGSELALPSPQTARHNTTRCNIVDQNQNSWRLLQGDLDGKARREFE